MSQQEIPNTLRSLPYISHSFTLSSTLISGGARVIENDLHWLVGRNFLKLNSIRSDIIVRQILPSFCGLLVAFSYSFVLKSFANGGPIISDEWGYLGPTRNSLASDMPISLGGNHLYSYFVLLVTDTTPLSDQMGYVLFNLLFLFLSMIVFCILIDRAILRVKILVCSTLGLSGTTLFVSTLMPEILTVFLSLISLLFLRYISLAPRIFLFGLLSIAFLGPFIKVHSVLLSCAILIQLIVLVTKLKFEERMRMLFVTLFAVFFAGTILFFTIERNSYSGYVSIKVSPDLTFSSLIVFFLLLLCSFSILCMISGRGFLALEIDDVGVTERTFIRTYSLVTVVTFSYFSWSVASLGSFEENRLHGRYFLPLLFVLLTYSFNFQYQNKARMRTNTLLTFLSAGFLIISGFTYLNIYPWDAPFLFGLSTGQSPWGWQLGTFSPLTLLLLSFLFLIFVLLLLRHPIRPLQALNVALVLALTVSSSLGVSAWVRINGGGTPGQAIDWAVANPAAECYPTIYPEYVVNSNRTVAIPPCN